jgi:hypothetical protein
MVHSYLPEFKKQRNKINNSNNNQVIPSLLPSSEEDEEDGDDKTNIVLFHVGVILGLGVVSSSFSFLASPY